MFVVSKKTHRCNIPIARWQLNKSGKNHPLKVLLAFVVKKSVDFLTQILVSQLTLAKALDNLLIYQLSTTNRPNPDQLSIANASEIVSSGRNAKTA